MHARFFETQDAAQAAAQAAAAAIRADWRVTVDAPRPMSAGFVAPADRARHAVPATVQVVWVRATGPFARDDDRDAGNASQTQGFAWAD